MERTVIFVIMCLNVLLCGCPPDWEDLHQCTDEELNKIHTAISIAKDDRDQVETRFDQLYQSEHELDWDKLYNKLDNAEYWCGTHKKSAGKAIIGANTILVNTDNTYQMFLPYFQDDVQEYGILTNQDKYSRIASSRDPDTEYWVMHEERADYWYSPMFIGETLVHEGCHLAVGVKSGHAERFPEKTDKLVAKDICYAASQSRKDISFLRSQEDCHLVNHFYESLTGDTSHWSCAELPLW